MNPKLKVVEASSDPRAELRRLIAEQTAREAEVEKLTETLERARHSSYRAEDAVREANAALGKAKTTQAQSLAADLRAGGTGSGDAVVVRKAREALAEAEDHLAATLAARRGLEADIKELTSESYQYYITNGIGAALGSETETLLARAIESRKAYRAQKEALKALEDMNFVAPHLFTAVRIYVAQEEVVIAASGPGHEMHVPAPDRGIDDFVAALRRLRTDADVQVPVI